MSIEWLSEKLSEQGIELSNTQKEQFQKYYQLLVEWNKKMNLTSITDEHEVKQTSNYINETVGNQTAYNNAVDRVKQIINQTSNPTMNPLEVERATSNVKSSKDALHGERELNDNKNSKTFAVNHLDNLNQAQKEALTH